MNSWKAIGIIFTLIGVVVLVIGLFMMLTLAGAFSPLSRYVQIPATVYLMAFLPYLGTAAVMFIIGGVGLYAGRTPAISPQNYQTYTQGPPQQCEMPVLWSVVALGSAIPEILLFY